FGVSTVAVDRLIKRYAEQVGITTDVSAHWLRHAHASHAIDNGANLVDVRDTLGHSSIATTNKYLHGKRKNSSSLKLGL
ncbi:MAG: tyrosine-type recombinase/integrase, partial [Caldilineaceae bacterium]|nr:tyrosine-type recombinase/integrase [Caldilineaceae bacterium]